MNVIYMDNAATTKIDPTVKKEMDNLDYGNPSSIHSMGNIAENAVNKARNQISKLINANGEEIIFTSGGTESDNAAILGVMLKAKTGHIITSQIEHTAVLETCKYLENNGYRVSYAKVNENGLVDPNEIETLISDDTKLVSIMQANNEVGTTQEISEIGSICREKRILFHTDAVQSFGKINIDVKEMKIDLLSGSGHKLHGPKGIGFLYIKSGIELIPIIHGGGQEDGYRSGTENVPGIVGIGLASEAAMNSLNEYNSKMIKIRDYITDEVLEIKDSYLNGDRSKRLSNNINVRFDRIEGEALVLELSNKGIMASTGSACSSAKLEPSHVLLAMGIDEIGALGSLRLSLSKYSTMDEAKIVVDQVRKSVEKLRKI